MHMITLPAVAIAQNELNKTYRSLDRFLDKNYEEFIAKLQLGQPDVVSTTVREAARIAKLHVEVRTHEYLPYTH